MKNCEKIHKKMYAIFRVIIEINRNFRHVSLFSSKKIKEADFADSLEPSKI